MVQDDMQRLLRVCRLMMSVEDDAPVWEALPEMLDDACAEAYWACVDLKEAYGVESLHWTLYHLDEALAELQSLLSLPFDEREAEMGRYQFTRPEVQTMLQMERMTWNRDTALQLELARTTEIMAKRLLVGWSPLRPGGVGQLSDEQALYALALGRLANALRAAGDLHSAKETTAQIRTYFISRCRGRVAAELSWILSEILKEAEAWEDAERFLRRAMDFYRQTDNCYELALAHASLASLLRSQARPVSEYISALRPALEDEEVAEALRRRNSATAFGLQLNMLLYLSEEGTPEALKAARHRILHLPTAPSTITQARQHMLTGVLSTDPAEAARSFATARSVYEALELPYHLATCLLHTALRCLRENDIARATTEAFLAVEYFDKLAVPRALNTAIRQLKEALGKAADQEDLIHCLKSAIRATTGRPQAFSPAVRFRGPGQP